jgi:glutathione S-transferase
VIKKVPSHHLATTSRIMPFTLYNAPQSTCSQRVRFVLNAKGLPFAEQKLDLMAGDQLKPDYLALNPNGVVPTLEHDGNIVIDSSVIIEYLDEIAPEPTSFTPRAHSASEDARKRASVERARMRALMRFIDEMPAAAVRVPTFNLAFLPRFAAMSEDEFTAFAESKPLRKEFMLAMGRKGFPEKDMNAALDRMRRTYERMDQAITASGGPWLLGQQITLADVAVMPALVRMADLGLAGMWKDMPRVSHWYDEIRAHAAFKPTYYYGSLLTEHFPHLRERAVS